MSERTDRPARRRPTRRRKMIRRTAWLFAGVIALVVAGFTAEAFAAKRLLEQAQPAVVRARAAAEAGDLAAAQRELRAAHALARRAYRKSNGTFTATVAGIPLLGRTAVAIRAGATAADLALQAGVRATGATGMFPQRDGRPSFGFHDGRIPIQAWAQAAGPIHEARELTAQAVRRAAAAPRSFVLPPVARALARLRADLAVLANATRHAAALSRTIPALAGAGGQKRYLLVLQNPAEARATGGLLGGVAILQADDGAIRLTGTRPDNDFGTLSQPARAMPDWYVRRYDGFRARTLWSSVNMEPDWPTTAPLVAAYYTAVTGDPVDGVIALDPYALSFMLQATGPVTGPHGVTFESSTVARYVMSDAYALFPPERSLERKAVVLDAASVIFERLKQGVEPVALARAMADAAAQKHVMIWMADADAQRAVAALGVDGRFRAPDAGTAMIGIVTQNGGANKIDFYLRRQIQIALVMRAGGDIDATVTVSLRNTAPASGLPRDVIGPPVVEGRPDRFQAGENVTYLNVFVPAEATDLAWTSEGAPVAAERHEVPGAVITSRFVDIPSMATVRSTVTFRLPAGFERDGLRLLVPRQPVVASDEITITVTAPPGRRIEGAADYEFSGPVNKDILLDLPVVRTFWRRVRDILWR